MTPAKHQPITSHRADGLGHWPAGKRRHEDVTTADERRRLREWFARHGQGVGPTRNPHSIPSAAAAIGVSPRTIRRWLSGEDVPDPHAWRRLLDRQRRA